MMFETQPSSLKHFIYIWLKHKNSEWVWDEHYEHYPLDEIVLFLEKVSLTL